MVSSSMNTKSRLSLKLDWLFSVGTSFRFAVFEVIEPSGVPQNGSEGRFQFSFYSFSYTMTILVTVDSFSISFHWLSISTSIWSSMR